MRPLFSSQNEVSFVAFCSLKEQYSFITEKLENKDKETVGNRNHP